MSRVNNFCPTYMRHGSNCAVASSLVLHVRISHVPCKRVMSRISESCHVKTTCIPFAWGTALIVPLPLHSCHIRHDSFLCFLIWDVTHSYVASSRVLHVRKRRVICKRVMSRVSDSCHVETTSILFAWGTALIAPWPLESCHIRHDSFICVLIWDMAHSYVASSLRRGLLSHVI